MNTSFALLFLKRASLTYSPHAKEFESDPKLLLPIEDDAGAADERSRTLKIIGTVPFLATWVVLGPFPNLERQAPQRRPDQRGEDPPLPDAPHRQARVEGVASERDFVDLDARDRQGRTTSSDMRLLPLVGSDQDAVLWFGSDEGAKVMLNRETVLYEHRHDLTGADAVAGAHEAQEGPQRPDREGRGAQVLLGLPRAADGHEGARVPAACVDPAGEAVRREQRAGATSTERRGVSARIHPLRSRRVRYRRTRRSGFVTAVPGRQRHRVRTFPRSDLVRTDGCNATSPEIRARSFAHSRGAGQVVICDRLWWIRSAGLLPCPSRA